MSPARCDTVQGNRYNIILGFGCRPSYVNILESYLLVWMWPVIIGLINLVYGVLAILGFMRHRNNTGDTISSHQALTRARYIRLVGLTLTLAIETIPPATLTIWYDIVISHPKLGLSWANIKWGFSAILFGTQFNDFMPSRPVLQVRVTNYLDWLYPLAALQFFLFFGFSEESRRSYEGVIRRIGKLLGISGRNSSQSKAGTTSIQFAPNLA
ncbi:STE3-domain-containing protein [Sistotremastrum niveocremeum HHB9708]|uniref:STE3-domain-containing protein n=1 Tax=Sistotremastrum niveocremeum HHB9708 TaxID=1314777 RepID=A0A164N067_9AGAM|nr:STE3-domain-containing protein [Sistotremastrum niveocremeum HHB9708]